MTNTASNGGSGTQQQDLFGNTDHPPKKGPGYLTWLNELDLPDGLTFWALSTEQLAPGVPKEHIDVIICTNPQGKWVQLVVDLRTGAKYEGEDPHSIQERLDTWGLGDVYDPKLTAHLDLSEHGAGFTAEDLEAERRDQ